MWLAASLLFVPHYEVTRASETAVSVTTDARANAYVVCEANDDSEYLSRFDPDGKLVYRIPAPPSPVPPAQFSAIAVDNAGNVYAALRAEGVARIDPTGNMVTFPAPFGALDSGALAIAPGPDGSFYLTGNADPPRLANHPGSMDFRRQSGVDGKRGPSIHVE